MSRISSGATKGEANGQLPISFRDLSIEIFIIKFVPTEVLLSQNYLFIFELHSQCIFFFYPNHKQGHLKLVN